MKLDLSDPVCSKASSIANNNSTNIYNRVGLFTSPSGKCAKSSSSGKISSSGSTNSVATNGGKTLSGNYRSSNTICDSGKSQLYYLENYANQHLDVVAEMKLKATSNGIDPREHDPSVTNNESESEECASSVCEENEFEMEDEEAEQSDAEIKVEDD